MTRRKTLSRPESLLVRKLREFYREHQPEKLDLPDADDGSIQSLAKDYARSAETFAALNKALLDKYGATIALTPPPPPPGEPPVLFAHCIKQNKFLGCRECRATLSRTDLTVSHADGTHKHTWPLLAAHGGVAHMWAALHARVPAAVKITESGGEAACHTLVFDSSERANVWADTINRLVADAVGLSSSSTTSSSRLSLRASTKLLGVSDTDDSRRGSMATMHVSLPLASTDRERARSRLATFRSAAIMAIIDVEMVEVEELEELTARRDPAALDRLLARVRRQKQCLAGVADDYDALQVLEESGLDDAMRETERFIRHFEVAAAGVQQ